VKKVKRVGGHKQGSTLSMFEDERTFYRRLIMRRYALLLQKVEQTFPGLDADTKARMKERVLNLSWTDEVVEKLMRQLGQPMELSLAATCSDASV
jgi:hypothetical protein